MVKYVVDRDEVYTLQEAAKELGIGIATLFRWKKAGKIHTLPVSGRPYVPKSEVRRLKKSRPNKEKRSQKLRREVSSDSR